jgi:hypothetical protein
MTKRLELYDWPKDPREIAEGMYRIARVLLLEARTFRAAGVPEGGLRKAAKMILAEIRKGRDVDVFYHRKVIREGVERHLEKERPACLGGHLFDLYCIEATGLNNPEFNGVLEKTGRA